MKALDILYSMIDNTRESPLSNKNNYEQLTYIAESIEELEAIEILANRGCNGCKYEKVVECEECIYCKTDCLDRWEPK